MINRLEKIVQQEKNKKPNLYGKIRKIIKYSSRACIGLGICAISYSIIYRAFKDPGYSGSGVELIALSSLGTMWGAAGIGSIIELYESLKK